MQRRLWKSLTETASSWRMWALPGAVVIGLVVGARLTGSLQGLELLALDAFLRSRPVERGDDRITLIGFDETDIKEVGYPIPDRELVGLLNTIQSYKPAAIGLHVFRTQIAKTDISNFFARLKQRQNVFVSEKVLPAAEQIPPPPGFSDKQVGTIDILPDGDNHVRHMILGVSDPLNKEAYKFSLAIRLTEAYLVTQDPSLTVKNGIRDPDAMRFGNTELPRLETNSGAYVGVAFGSPEMLLNFRHHPDPFRLLSVKQIKAGNFDPSWLYDRIVIVGITDPNIRPIIPTATLKNTNSLQLQAHTISQIISAVLDQRLLLRTWNDEWEYIWIICWGFLGVALSRRSQFPLQTLGIVGIANFLLIGACYTLLIFIGLWLPVIPAFLVLNLSVLLPAVYEYVYIHEKALKTRLDERQKTLEQTFHAIHNGPLQSLASVLRRTRDTTISQNQILVDLENLNREIRGISDHLKQETLIQEDSLYLGNGTKIDLKLPIHELFYEVYSHTLERPDFARFETLRVACNFDPIDSKLLSTDQKRDLCRFLEEALCNVGKHAHGTTRLEISGIHNKNQYFLRVTDNGNGIKSLVEGEGTKYARKLATRLKGHFKREFLSPKGTLCELAFPLMKSWL